MARTEHWSVRRCGRACQRAGWACSWPTTVAPYRVWRRWGRRFDGVVGVGFVRSVSIRNERVVRRLVGPATEGGGWSPGVWGGGYFVDLGSHVLDFA